MTDGGITAGGLTDNTITEAPRVLLLSGWQDSCSSHWQTRWQAVYGFERVEQADWHWPRRGDWMARLEDVLLDDPRPTLLVAHSLGCHLVAAWAAHTQHAAHVQGALLVAPPDVDRADMPPQLHNWRPAVRARLPFPALVLHSDDDPYGHPQHARRIADDWGAATVNLGPLGHINGESGLGDWPEGLHWLQRVVGSQPVAG